MKIGILFLFALISTHTFADTEVAPVAKEAAATITAQDNSEITALIKAEGGEKNISEENQPVFKAAAEKASHVEEKKASSSIWIRMLASLAIVITLVVAGGFAYKKFPHATKGAKQARMIQILGHHNLGAKKSLAVIRVAGETILIGITDQNINLLKALSLLDEDLPGESIVARTKFTGALKEKVEEEFSMEGIKDIVSKRITDLRGNQA